MRKPLKWLRSACHLKCVDDRRNGRAAVNGRLVCGECQRSYLRALQSAGFRSRNHRRGSRNHPLSEAQQEANRRKSKIRARVEHVFGAQENTAGGRIVRTIGIVRARAKIGLQNLVYNIRRLVVLERVAAA